MKTNIDRCFSSCKHAPHKKELNAFLKGYCTKKGGSPDLIQDGVLYLCKLRDLPDVEIWAPSAEPVNRLTISLRE